jgi:hypothetical protein
MKCREHEDLILDYLDGSLGPERRPNWKAILPSALLAQLRAAQQRIDGMLKARWPARHSRSCGRILPGWSSSPLWVSWAFWLDALAGAAVALCWDWPFPPCEGRGRDSGSQRLLPALGGDGSRFGHRAPAGGHHRWDVPQSADSPVSRRKGERKIVANTAVATMNTTISWTTLRAPSLAPGLHGRLRFIRG